MLADYYAGTGQIDKARAEFANLAKKYPKSLSVQEGYVRILIQVKDYATAQSVVTELMKKNGKDPQGAKPKRASPGSNLAWITRSTRRDAIRPPTQQRCHDRRVEPAGVPRVYLHAAETSAARLAGKGFVKRNAREHAETAQGDGPCRPGQESREQPEAE